MKTICGVQVPESVSDVLSVPEWSEAYYNWSAANAEDFINCPDRAARCYDAAAEGCDGSTHAEHIDDFREYGSDLFRDLRREFERVIESDDYTTEQETDGYNLLDECEVAYEQDCDSLEDWHFQNGSLNQQVG